MGVINLSENKTDRTKKFYNIFFRVYDPFKSLWNKIFSQKAEEKLSEFLLFNLDKETTILEWVFSAKYVPENEIKQFSNVSNFHKFSADMVSVVEIKKR